MRFGELLATDGVEERCELRSTVGVMAFHGGNLERVTEEIAEAVANRTGASLYTVVQHHPLRQHVPSSKVLRSESTALNEFLGHVSTVIAVHGYGREGMWTSLLLGGSNRTLAASMATHLRRELPDFNAVDDVEQIPSDLRGLHRDNPVNVPSNGGVQIELPPRVRGLTPHAASMERVDGMIVWTRRLVTAISCAVNDLGRVSQNEGSPHSH